MYTYILELGKFFPYKNMINGVWVPTIIHEVYLNYKRTMLNFSLTISMNKINENPQYFVVLYLIFSKMDSELLAELITVPKISLYTFFLFLYRKIFSTPL